MTNPDLPWTPEVAAEWASFCAEAAAVTKMRGGASSLARLILAVAARLAALEAIIARQDRLLSDAAATLQDWGYLTQAGEIASERERTAREVGEGLTEGSKSQ